MRPTTMIRLLCLGLLLTPAGSQAQLPIPRGVDFQVNSHEPGNQFLPAGAVAPDGAFLVVWTSLSSPGTDDSRTSVLGRLFTDDGLPVGPDFQVNTSIDGSQRGASTAVLPNGEFVVTWGDSASYPEQPSIRGQRIAANGDLVGSEFVVSDSGYGYPSSTAIAAVGTGNEFVVAWDTGDGGENGEIRMRRMAADGTPLTATRNLAGYPSRPSIGVDAAGNYAVAWYENVPFTGQPQVLASFFAADGTVLQNGKLLIEDTFRSIDLAMRPNGEFLLVTTRPNGDGVEAWRFSADGTLLGPPDLLADEAFPSNGAAIATPQGYFVTWNQMSPPGTEANIYGQAFLEDGSRFDQSFLVNSNLDFNQSRAALASNADGRLLVAWEYQYFITDVFITDIQARRFRVGTTCEPGDETLCLTGGRFAVDVEWEIPDGTTGRGQAVPLTDDSGFFWFFGPNNIELVVKVLDACSLFDRFWVFAGGLTDVEVDITVTDTLSGESVTYNNPQQTPFQPIQDTSAFMTCP